MRDKERFILKLADLFEEYNASVFYTTDDDGVHVALNGSDIFVGHLGDSPEAADVLRASIAEGRREDDTYKWVTDRSTGNWVYAISDGVRYYEAKAEVVRNEVKGDFTWGLKPYFKGRLVWGREPSAETARRAAIAALKLWGDEPSSYPHHYRGCGLHRRPRLGTTY